MVRELPIAFETRYRELIAKRQAGTISTAELEELKSLTDQAEKLQAERMADLVSLAQLCDVSLTDLMTDLGIKPSPVE